jgi:VCBS repeat protein
VAWDGRGEFRVAQAGAVSLGPRPTDVVAADFNRDGRLDVACANHETDHVSVLLGDGMGAFTPARGSPIQVQSQPHPHGIAAADVDGDGRLDLVTESRDTSTIEISPAMAMGPFATLVGWCQSPLGLTTGYARPISMATAGSESLSQAKPPIPSRSCSGAAQARVI